MSVFCSLFTSKAECFCLFYALFVVSLGMQLTVGKLKTPEQGIALARSLCQCYYTLHYSLQSSCVLRT